MKRIKKKPAKRRVCVLKFKGGPLNGRQIGGGKGHRKKKYLSAKEGQSEEGGGGVRRDLGAVWPSPVAVWMKANIHFSGRKTSKGSEERKNLP